VKVRVFAAESERFSGNSEKENLDENAQLFSFWTIHVDGIEFSTGLCRAWGHEG
jgi:hypothetical protein